MMRVEVTVKKGKCSGQIHEKGQRYIVDWKTPDGMCIGAWDAISPYLLTMLCGGRFPWEKKENGTEIHCPDPGGITLELKRLKD